MMHTSKRYLMENEKTLHSYAKHDCELNQHWSVRERSDFMTSRSEENSQSR